MNIWWGYLHANGILQVKRYFDDRDLEEARKSDFVKRVVPPFDAINRDDAIIKLRKIIDEY